MGRETEAATACQPDPGYGTPGDSRAWQLKRLAETGSLTGGLPESAGVLFPPGEYENGGPVHACTAEELRFYASYNGPGREPDAPEAG